MKKNIKKIVPFLFILSVLMGGVYFLYSSHDSVDCKSVVIYKTKHIKASEIDAMRFNMLGLYGTNIQEYTNVSRQSLLLHVDNYHMTVVSQFQLVVPYDTFDKNIFLMKLHNTEKKLNEIYDMQVQSESTTCSKKPNNTQIISFLILIGLSFLLFFRSYLYTSKCFENEHH